MRTIPCPLCLNTTSRRVWQQVYAHLTLTTVLCPTCGLVYHNPVLEENDRQDLGLSHRELHTDAVIGPRHLRRVGRRLALQAAFLQTVVQPGWRTLEIGCGLGFLSDWLSRQGCVAVGLEPDWQQAEFARERFGLEIINVRMEEATLSRQFDFMASSHVIEHFPEPLAFLKNLHTLAAPGALLFLETPNILAPKVGPRRVFSLAHNFYFSPQTLTAGLAKTGWQVERLRIFRRDSFMVLARAQQAREPRFNPRHAQEVWQAIVRHRRQYYLNLLFIWRKIPLWRRLWMYHYLDYAGVPEIINPSVSEG